MAYQYSEGVANGTADLLLKLQTFVVTTTGWTSVQSTITNGATGQYFAASSTGESGTERLFIRFHRQAINAINSYGYLSWAAGTGRVMAGSTSVATGTGTYIQADDNDYIQYWFFGSLDRIIVCTRVGQRAGVTDTFYIGLYNRAKSANFNTNGGALTAGTNVVIPVANTTYYTVGNRYVVADDNNFEYPKVTAINPATSITVDILQNSYANGAARIGEDVRPMVVTASTTGMGLGNASHYLLAPPYRGGPSVAAGAVQLVQGGYAIRTVDQTMIEQTTPDGSVGGTFNLFPFFVHDTSMMSGAFLGTLTECYVTGRNDIATDDTITAGGITYHYIETASAATATGAGSIGLAIRRA